MSFSKPSIGDTVSLITELHSGQFDKSGQPYEFHPQRVAQNLMRLFPDATIDEIHAALLHDVVEDCGVTSEFLLQKGYSEECVRIVELVTKPENDTRSYDQVIDDLIASGNRGAMRVKIADNAENLHPERVENFSQIDPEKAANLSNQYQRSISKLCRALGIDQTFIAQAISTSPSLQTQKFQW